MRFVDTSFWVALLFRRDAHHAEARAVWAANRAPLVTTNHVAGETWTFLSRRIGHAAAVDFLDRWGVLRARGRIRLVHVDEAVEDDAWAWLRRHDENVYSFVDATSFATMWRLRIREALTYDGDFAAVGFTLVAG